MKHVFIVDGARTPFMRSSGHFKNLSALDLSIYCINGLLRKLSCDPSIIDYLCWGSVISDPSTSNIAREAVLKSTLPIDTPAHSVSMACISSNMAATSVVDLLRSGHIKIGIAGGAETFSDAPIRLHRNLRKILIETKKKKSTLERLKLWSSLRPEYLSLDIPSPKEYSTGFSMGEAGDQLAALFSITREEADSYALLSHERAALALRDGFYNDQIIPVDVPTDYHTVTKDDGPRPNSTLLDLKKLRPAFDSFGINTAANSSFFSDGASALVLASEDGVKAHNFEPKALIVDYVYKAGDPRHELLLGPALTLPHLLERNALKLKDVTVIEMHEAFAGQVLANVAAMASEEFCKNRLKLDAPVGSISIDSLNRYGGSLSLGHPFGATGTRLLFTAAKRLQKEKSQYAIVTGCAASGLGSAILLKRV